MTSGGRLALNVLHFARLLRRAGLPIGSGMILDALAAIRVVGVNRRTDCYWALHSTLVRSADQRDAFDAAFRFFWRNPRFAERMHSALLPPVRAPVDSELPHATRRVASAAGAGLAPGPEVPPQLDIDASLTSSATERLTVKDFEQMSLDELAQAGALLARLALNRPSAPSRRYRPDTAGPRIDLRASLRGGMRHGGHLLTLRRQRRAARPRPLVLLCDVSGSMIRYSRMLMLFAHTVATRWGDVATFTFGTRLTNVTRHLRDRDVDRALAAAAGAVDDWDGGTRIGQCLGEFNRRWARRVLTRGAIVVLVTDGLDRGDPAEIETAVARLGRNCHRLIWLNPLLRYERFEPKAGGIRALLPHVDAFRPAHNVDSLVRLGEEILRPIGPARVRPTDDVPGSNAVAGFSRPPTSMRS